MKTLRPLPKGLTSTLWSLILVCLAIVLYSCKEEKKADKHVKLVETEKVTINTEIIEIVTETMDFQMPDTIASGWQTFQYKNNSNQTHFFLVDRYPEGKTSKDAKELVAPVFDKAMQLIMDGKTQEGYAEFANLPDWFTEVQFLGGSGLISPNGVAQMTMQIEPGRYVIECYVKMENGIFHTSMGMIKDLYVTSKSTTNEPPKASKTITVSSTGGITLNDSLATGTHTFKVNFKDQKAYEHFLGHDVHLVKLSDEGNIEALEVWMNWAEPDGLREPAPNGISFLGGVNDMPAGSTAYFTATLEAGNYALIAEVPKAREKNMLKRFSVSD